jgi:ABC-type branched-subunit amino acid transport system permease subunit
VRVLAVTGGESGLRPIGGLPRGIPGGEGWRALVAIGLSVLAVLAVATLRGSRLERSARAIADSAELALGLGLSPWVVRFKLLTICSGLVGLMGAAMALYRQGVSPDDFALGRSILVVGIASLVANGGTTRVLVVAAAVLTSAEALQLMMPATPVAQVAFGLLLVGAAAWRRS